MDITKHKMHSYKTKGEVNNIGRQITIIYGKNLDMVKSLRTHKKIPLTPITIYVLYLNFFSNSNIFVVYMNMKFCNFVLLCIPILFSNAHLLFGYS